MKTLITLCALSVCGIAGAQQLTQYQARALEQKAYNLAACYLVISTYPESTPDMQKKLHEALLASVGLYNLLHLVKVGAPFNPAAPPKFTDKQLLGEHYGMQQSQAAIVNIRQRIMAGGKQLLNQVTDQCFQGVLRNELPESIAFLQMVEVRSVPSAPQPAVGFGEVPAPQLHNATPAAKPSFDCAKAATRVETMICSYPALAKDDSDMAAFYKKNLAVASRVNPKAVAEIRIGQRAFLARRNACADASCVAEAYRVRWEELAQMGFVRE